MTCQCSGYGITPNYLDAIGVVSTTSLQLIPRYCDVCPVGLARAYYDKEHLTNRDFTCFRDWLNKFMTELEVVE